MPVACVRNKMEHEMTFVRVEGDLEQPPLISAEKCERLGLVKRLWSIEQSRIERGNSSKVGGRTYAIQGRKTKKISVSF